ncbi:MAG: ATP-binding cassette domain-containing protein [Hydrotalea flava]|uniref:ABC-F family ATP-binding cassette domain-containing protein n=2 Tax=Hydrotalea TaxID=1004300 RepID=UPI0016B5B466|nr:ABC-F family ATP-binding cassette domain-containing protein [Hydrotalea lipotrueae]MBY0347713.1 ATP-binding cassette domain-containing protein [Hydrotalea flava]NIM35525.1 ATP-binding cassette domain-containing protein [Hydrotalea flava]NIM38382.1 ATP-binding cassette domain-containing protein [Hydrotalea flava]NIN03552.1 ATP-binding cassette domain-containing protein [Hydrotalea flava]NIN15239.1 ATP-binding cassette domain-containing protein [Hydrotalea flava]
MLIGLQNVTFEFGARVIVADATWHIQPGDRIGLIGYNGTGKSTLLKVLVGEYTPSKGTVEKGKDTTIGYLHQDLLSFDTNDSILEVAMGAFEKVKQLEREIAELGKILETKEDEALLMAYTDKLHELEVAGGYTIHHRTEEVLQGLGFQNADLHRPYKEFSGGWRMRVLLAKMILQQPDVLLLDEPTNHLDLPSIEWLEKYLKHYQGSVVIVSHDKFFLNRMVNKIVELYQQQLHVYVGDFDFYEKEKELRIELQQKAYENQQEYIRQQERFIERFRSKATKAAAAQSAIKRLDKIERIENVSLERPNMRINFQVEKQPGKIICELKNIDKKFGISTILQNASAEINRGDKIALIGANGKGKSTLLRIVAGTETFEGLRNWGHNVEESFYAQHQLEALNLNNSILDEMKECGSNKNELELRTLLGCFLFSGDDSDKKIRLLSGGEKARVALAKVIVSRSNFLLLDEPTNHLDMHSVELLAEALNNYEGSYLLVSHDRFFISKTANKIWEIVDHQIKEFKGTYQEWVEWNERMAKQNSSKKEGKAATPQPVKEVAFQKNNTPFNQPEKQQKKELAQVKRKFQQTEALLETLNEKKSALEISLVHPDLYKDPAKFSEFEKAYAAIQKEWDAAQQQYEILFEKLMELEG